MRIGSTQPQHPRWPLRLRAAVAGLALPGTIFAVVGVAAPGATGPGDRPAADAPVPGEAVEVVTPAVNPGSPPREDSSAREIREAPPAEAAAPPALPQREIDAAYVDDGAVAAAGPPAPTGGDDADHGGAGDARARRAQRLAAAFPAHAAADQGDEANTRRWALVVGVDDYRAGVRDTLGSVADARLLSQLLRDHGWRDDHVLTLTDEHATGEMIRAGIEWLAARADESSEVVVSFSGHLRHRDGVTALWPTDDDYLWADELGARLARVDADAMWLSFQGCHAQGLRSPQLHRDGRVITYSSKAAQKSHEDPDTGHSVQGYYLFAEGLRDGLGDPGAEHVSVRDAFRWAAPRAEQRTAGRQTPQIWDGLDEPFTLAPAGR